MAVTSITVNPDPIRKARTATFTINLDTDTPNAVDIGNIRVSSVYSGTTPLNLTRVTLRQWTFTLDVTSNELRIRVWVNNVLFIDRFGSGLADPPPRPVPTITFERSGTPITTAFAGETVDAVISWSQAFEGDFETGDVGVTGGTKSSFSGSGTTYRQAIRLNARQDATLTVSIDADVVSNSEGEGSAAAQATLPFVRPTPTVTFRTDSGISGVNAIADVVFDSVARGIDGAEDFQLTNCSFVSISTVTPGRAFAVTVRPDRQKDATATLAVPENRAINGNKPASDTLPFVRPTLSIAFNSATIKPGIQTALTLTSNAPILGLLASEIQVSGGVINSINASANQATINATPTRFQDGTLTVTIPENALLNGNRRVSTNKDYKRPVVTVTLDRDDVGNSEQVIATFTWDVAPERNDFDRSDVTLSGGTRGAFSGSGRVFRQVVTSPSSGAGSVSVGVRTNAIHEGNVGKSASFTYVPIPIPTISWSTNNPISGREFVAVVNFTRDVSRLVASYFTVTGGTRGSLTRRSARRWDLRITPTAQRDGTLTISLPADVVDEGNVRLTASIGYLRPRFTMTRNPSHLDHGEEGVVTVVCSIATTFFLTEDITVVGATKGAFVRVDASNYTQSITAPSVGEGTITVTIRENIIPEGNPAVSVTFNYSDIALLRPVFSVVGAQRILLNTDFRLEIPIANEPTRIELVGDYKEGFYFTAKRVDGVITAMVIIGRATELFTDTWEGIAENTYGQAVPPLSIEVEVVPPAPVIGTIPRRTVRKGVAFSLEIPITNVAAPKVRGLLTGLTYEAIETGVRIFGTVPRDAEFTVTEASFTVTDSNAGGEDTATGIYDISN